MLRWSVVSADKLATSRVVSLWLKLRNTTWQTNEYGMVVVKIIILIGIWWFFWQSFVPPLQKALQSHPNSFGWNCQIAFCHYIPDFQVRHQTAKISRCLCFSSHSNGSHHWLIILRLQLYSRHRDRQGQSNQYCATLVNSSLSVHY